MNTKAYRLLAALVLAGFVAGPMAGCSEAKREKAETYVEDSVISNTVRAKLLDDKDLNVTRIDVTTSNGVVRLSGNVPSETAKARAATVAGRVNGVRSVQNNLVVR